MFYHRGVCHDIEALHLKVVALCALFCLSAFGPCTMTGTHNPVGYDEYGSYRNDLNSGSEDVLIGDGRKRIPPQSSITKLNLENICKRSDLFCFPSTLSGFFADFRSSEANLSGFSEVKPHETVNLGPTKAKNNPSSSSDSGNFRLSSGSVVSCSLELKTIDNSDQNDTSFCKRSSLDSKTSRVNQKEESVRIKSSPMDDNFSSLHVQISHPLLDWGQKYLHFPSLAFLTVENRHNRSVLNVFEPYSTDSQFYPCNYSEIKLGPGEVASICFVFLPKSLGFSSAHLILQTSSGGFLIQAQGFAVESPYMIQSSVGLNYSSNGKWSYTVSVFNPSGKALHLKEVIAWMLFSSGSVSYCGKAICSQIDHKGSSELSVKEWLDVKIGEIGQPVMTIRPQKTWTVGSNSNEPILELEFPNRPHAIFASFVGQVLNGSRDNSDTIILEAELGGKSGFYDLETLSISLDVLIPCDANGTTSVSLSLQNNGPGLLTVVKIRAVGENSQSLQTKYVEGLMLFPHSVTQVATVTYTPDSHVNLNCKLVVETNKSDAPEVEISCRDIASLCSRSHSYARYGHHDGMLNYDDSETRSSNVRVQSPMEIKATEVRKSDESVLGNWRSQGTENGMSVLDDDEIIFPLVHVGSHRSKWISVVNPSDQPVLMQLLLNSGEIVNECRGSDEILQPSSSYTLVLNGHTTPSRYGFSIAANALTEAYVHPHGKAYLGPIIFRPSSRCVWRSSALVRNNLSGVEWVPLRGSGGLLSLLLLDGSEPVSNIKLKHNLPRSINRSMKVVFAKNTGDLPLEVERISVSGTKCGSDGFMVDTCGGFSLQPGESRKLVISYRADFCAEIVRRELELVMAGGMLIVPMEVGLSTPMLTVCKRSVIWTRFKKFILAVFVSVLMISMASSCSFSFTIRGGNLSKSEEDSSVVCRKPEPEPVKKVTSSSLSSSSKSIVEEASKPENLTVKTGKEKARRRKKKRGSGSGLTGQFEALSSHSSNSTPSSPLSPASSSTPKRSPELSPNVRARNPFKNSVALPPQDKPLVPAKTVGPRAKAPGGERKTVKPVEGSGSEARFTYNIWDDHLRLRVPVAGSAEVVCGMPTIAEDNNFGSLFAISPQELFTSVAETVSFKQDD